MSASPEFPRSKNVFGATEYDIYPPKIAEMILKDDREIIETNCAILNRTELIVDKSGHLIWVTTNKLPLIAMDGHVAGLMGTTRILSQSEELPDEYQQMRPVIDHIQGNVDKKIEIKELARLSFLSNSQFRKRFRIQFRVSPQEFILQTRLQAASKKLISTDQPIIKIALSCGFGDQSYFTKQFSRFFETSPGRYRATWGQK
ncbi:MAG: AraC family transcriptional regulator [Blastopirellula sp.]|nr:MAG: AraC family transcriptional regulator [Blastopirellula sp.]